ncbi:MAG: hypothetical protein II874_09235 [Bacteroidales bacterium]|nr:hypothetical protein [Bacteroidales bacterium]
MKKILSFLAIAAMVIVACSKKPTPTPTPTPEPEPEPEPEYVAPITIDGDFADWAKLDASKVATATCPSDPKYDALKTLKVYADEHYIFMYAEFTPQEEGAPISWDVFMNADNSAETGGYADFWNEPDNEWLFEGGLDDWDASLFKWWGEVGANSWTWADPSVDHGDDDAWGAFVPAAGFCASSADLVNGKVEFSIMREMLEETVKFADTFTMGAMLSVSWTTAGVLPCAPITDDNTSGIAPKLKVTVVK